MPNWQDFSIDLVQTAIFTPEHSAFNSGKAVGIVLANGQDRFDGEMQVLPLPSEVPPEIPRVILASMSGQWRLSMAPTRTDSVWRHVEGITRPSLDAVVQDCVQVHERYVRATGVRVGRVGLMIQRVCPISDPARALIEQFCNEASQGGPFSRSESFEISNYKVYRPPQQAIDYSINSWVRCKTDKRAGENSSVILVQQDLNTLATELETRRFDAGQIQAYFQVAAAEADVILQKYFPGSESPCHP